MTEMKSLPSAIQPVIRAHFQTYIPVTEAEEFMGFPAGTLWGLKTKLHEAYENCPPIFDHTGQNCFVNPLLFADFADCQSGARDLVLEYRLECMLNLKNDLGGLFEAFQALLNAQYRHFFHTYRNFVFETARIARQDVHNFCDFVEEREAEGILWFPAYLFEDLRRLLPELPECMKEVDGKYFVNLSIMCFEIMKNTDLRAAWNQVWQNRGEIGHRQLNRAKQSTQKLREITALSLFGDLYCGNVTDREENAQKDPNPE